MDYLTFCESVLGPGNKAGPDEYDFECPNGCGVKLGVNVEKGIYKCFICGGKDTMPWRDKYNLSRKGRFFGSGPLQLLAAYFNKEDVFSGKASSDNLPVTRTVVIDSKPIPLAQYRVFLTTLFTNPQVTSFHKEFLDERGFTEQYWLAKGIKVHWGDNPLSALSSSIALKRIYELLNPKEIIDYKLVNEEGRVAGWLKDKILIPYPNQRDNIILGARGRTTLKVAKVKYLGPYGLGTSRLIYNLPDLNDTDTILLSEGELKTKMASLFGVKAVALPGVTTAKDAALDYIIRAGIKRLVVCFDTESLENLDDEKLKSKQQAKEAVESAWQFFKYYGKYNGIETLKLELPDEGHKSDIDSFILEHGPGEFYKLLEDIGVSFPRNWSSVKEVSTT